LNILLLLSALLSAFTGALAGAGQVAPRPALSRGLAAAPITVRVVPQKAARPQPARITLATVAAAPIAMAVAPLPASPIFASRRRE